MLRESVQSWTQDPWQLIDNSNATNIDVTYDANSFLSTNHAAAAALQLQDLFGQDELDFDRDPLSMYFDEFTFVPDTSNTVNTIEPSNLIYTDKIMDSIVTTEAPVSKRRRSSSNSSTSSLSSCSSSSSSSGEEEDTFSMLNSISSRRSNLSSDSEEEDEQQQQQQQQEIMSSFVHRRQMEEMILDKISNHLDPEKLPGILTIISKTHEEEVEEVEIDLARLDRDQLSRILSYVNACLLEKEGGPKVKLSDFTIQSNPKKIQQLEKAGSSSKKQRRKRSHRRKSIVDQGHIVSGSSHSQLSASHGPISMSALTEIESNKKSKKPNKKKRVKKNDASVRMPSTPNQQVGIATTKPKRRSAVHKRRLLEDMLQPSSNESDQEDEGGCGIVIFGDEQMDLAVTHNETIVHQERRLSIVHQSAIVTEQPMVFDDDEDEELIDIMM